MTTTNVFSRYAEPVSNAYFKPAMRLVSIEKLPNGGLDVQHWADVPADEAHSDLVKAFIDTGALPEPHENGVIPLLTLDHFKDVDFKVEPRTQDEQEGFDPNSAVA